MHPTPFYTEVHNDHISQIHATFAGSQAIDYHLPFPLSRETTKFVLPPVLIVLVRVPSDYSRKEMHRKSGKDRKIKTQVTLLIFSEDLNVCDLDLSHMQDIH